MDLVADCTVYVRPEPIELLLYTYLRRLLPQYVLAGSHPAANDRCKHFAAGTTTPDARKIVHRLIFFRNKLLSRLLDTLESYHDAVSTAMTYFSHIAPALMPVDQKATMEQKLLPFWLHRKSYYDAAFGTARPAAVQFSSPTATLE